MLDEPLLLLCRRRDAEVAQLGFQVVERYRVPQNQLYHVIPQKARWYEQRCHDTALPPLQLCLDVYEPHWLVKPFSTRYRRSVETIGRSVCISRSVLTVAS